MIDLHTHSSVSDGTDGPAELVAVAAAAGVTTLALTDHDTTGGWDAARDALPAGMSLVRGAEFSTDAPGADGGTVTAHLLGYLFDPHHAALVAEQDRLRDERRDRVATIGARLAAAGYAIDVDALLAGIPEGSSAGRPHLARALVDAGRAADLDDAFARFLGEGSPYYTPKRNTPIAAAVALVRDAGGVPVLAHAFSGRRGVPASVIEDLVGVGLAGVEVDHPEHDAGARAALRRLVTRHGLLATGSSDYHGRAKTTPIAAETTAPEVLAALVAQATGVAVVTGGP